MSEQHKTLGQVCFEEMWQAESATTGAYVLHWADVRPAVRLWWESAAAAVKAAVLAEQEAPACPSCGRPGRYVCGPCIEAAIRRRNLPDQSPGERAYEMWRRYAWDNQKNPTLEWDQLTMRDHANWEVIADPDGSPRRAGERGTTDRRAISPEEMRAHLLMAHIDEAIVRGLSMSQALRLDAQTALAIQVAIRDGIMAGLNSWEETRHG